MRLPDFVNQIRRRFSEASNFARNPDQVIYQQGRKVALAKYERMALPGSGEQKPTPADSPNELSVPLLNRFGSPGKRSPSAAPVSPLSTAPVALAPAPQPELADPDWARLQPGDVLTRGWVGRYVVGTCLQDDGWMRLYEGIQESGNEAVWIYEYRLSDTVFNERDRQARRTAFKQVIDRNSRLGEGSDFRILKLRDVIASAQQPCYVITQGLPGGEGLATCLARRGHPFTPNQVREFLRQVLQSLQYLQAYQVHWPDGSSQIGLPHGNLHLESVWIRFSEAKTPHQADTFFVYLSRLALWEHLFYAGDPPIQAIAQTTSALGNIAADFQGLGQMALTLLTGNAQLDPTNVQAWPEDPQVRSLYPYICRLMGQGPEEPFRSPSAAIAALRILPQSLPTVESAPADVGQSESRRYTRDRRTKLWPWLLAVLGAGTLLWLWFLRGSPRIVLGPPICDESNDCVLNLSAFDDETPVVYGVEPGSYWEKSFARSLGSPVVRNRFLFLEDSLENRTQAESSTLIRAQTAPRDRADLLDQIQRGQLQAGFVRGDQGLLAGVVETNVAYDGIAIFVIHSDVQRDRNVARRLEKPGQISLTELRELFTQRQLTLGSDETPVKLYFPQGYQHSDADADFKVATDTIKLFRELVFTDPNDQAQFDAVQRQVWQDVVALDKPPASIYAHMLDDFETQAEGTIGIGFDRISRMNGQCSVYPLTLTDGDGMYPILVKADGNPVDLNTDLCGDKGTYWVNSEIFEAPGHDPNAIDYPLGYAMAVAHPDHCTVNTSGEACQPAGALLAQTLLSLEGQYLLSEVGLVPVEPIRRIRRFLWR